MKSSYFFLILFCCAFQLAAAQTNLVPNPGFEQYSQCPDEVNDLNPVDQVTKATGWSSYRDTPDYFNTCAPTSSSTTALVSVPYNGCGYQVPASGNAYCGLSSYVTNTLYREYLGAQLTSSLTIGQKQDRKCNDNRYRAGRCGGAGAERAQPLCRANQHQLLHTRGRRLCANGILQQSGQDHQNS